MCYDVLHKVEIPTVTDFDLLSHLGEKSDSFVTVSSEDEALKGLLSSEWQEYTEEAQGNLTEWLTLNHPKRYQGVWNAKIREVRPTIESLINNRLLPQFSATSTPLRDCLRWDLLFCEMDCYYSDLNKRPLPGQRIRYIYEAGFLPCGLSSTGEILAY